MGDVFILLTVRERKYRVQVCQFDEYARSVTACTHCIVYTGYVKPLPQQQGMKKKTPGGIICYYSTNTTHSETGRHKQHWRTHFWSDRSLGVLSGELDESLQLILWIKHIQYMAVCNSATVPQIQRSHRWRGTSSSQSGLDSSRGLLPWDPVSPQHTTAKIRQKEEYKDRNKLDWENPQTLLWSCWKIFVLWNLPNFDSKENHQTVARTEKCPHCF